MRWLKRLIGAQSAPPLAAEQSGPEAWLRAGYDCVTRGDAAGAESLFRKVGSPGTELEFAL